MVSPCLTSVAPPASLAQDLSPTDNNIPADLLGPVQLVTRHADDGNVQHQDDRKHDHAVIVQRSQAEEG